MDIPPPPPPPPPNGPYGAPHAPANAPAFPPASPYGGMPPVPVKRSGLGIAALVLGIVGIPLCFIFIPSLLAFIFGLVAAHNIKKAGQRNTPGTGFGMARAGWILGLIGLLFFAAFVIADASGALDDDDAVSVNSLSVGDCVNLDGFDADDTVFGLPRVDCDEPHDGEIYVEGDLPAGDYPGVEEVRTTVSNRCEDEFTDFVGETYEDSELDYTTLYPIEESWSFDRGYLCIVTTLDQSKLDESVEGSGR